MLKKDDVVLNKPRNPWIAGILTLLTIGLGHIYAGAAKKGIVFFIVPQIVTLGVLVSLMILTPNAGGIIAAAVTIIGSLGFVIYCIVDSVKIARKRRKDYSLKKYNRWYVYLLFWMFAVFCLQPFLGGTIKTNLIQAYKMPSGSMRPTLEIGDYILSKKKLLMGSDIRRGDIVIFPYPKDPEKKFVKRVVGLGGESLEIKDKHVYINDEPLNESYKIHVDTNVLPAGSQPRDNLGPFTIPEDSLFLLGDNRDESNDSRYFGFVKKSAVRGKVYLIYWSRGKFTFDIRWNRIGKSL